MVYTVTFNPAIDYVVHVDDMEPGMTNRTKSEEIYFGGKGINVSIVLPIEMTRCSNTRLTLIMEKWKRTRTMETCFKKT